MAFEELDRYIKLKQRAKRKYAEKVLSLSAMDIMYQRILDGESWFSDWAWQYLPLFLNLNISSLFIFALSPEELLPFSLDFVIELPSIEEWLEGIRLKFKKIDIGTQWQDFFYKYYLEIVPPKLDFDTFIDFTIPDIWIPSFKREKERKLIIGKTKYGEGYVDPPVIREFLTSTFYELFKRKPRYERLKELIDEVMKTQEIEEWVGATVFHRINMLTECIYQDFILDVGILNISVLHPKSSKHSVIIEDYTGIPRVVEYEKLHDIQMGFILDISYLNEGYLLPKNFRYRVTVVGVTPYFIMFQDKRVRDLISRFRATHIGFINYQRIEEMMDWHKSERAEQYGELQRIRYTIDSMVTNILKDKDVDAFRLNLYKRAVNQLIGHKKKRHKWGYDGWKAMTEEEFKNWWIEHWVRQGLNRDLLNLLYERLIKVCQYLRDESEKLGERLKRTRERLAQYRA